MAGPQNFDDIRAAAPFDTVDGQETILLQVGGVTKGGFLSVLKTWVLQGLQVAAAAISDASESGRTVLTGTKTQGLNALGAQAALTTATLDEAEAGTSTTVRNWTPERVRQAVTAVTSALTLWTPKTAIAFTAARTLGASDSQRYLVGTPTAAIDFTLPLTGSTFTTADYATVVNTTTNVITLKVATGATLVGKGITGNTTTLAQWDSARIQCIGADRWFVEK